MAPKGSVLIALKGQEGRGHDSGLSRGICLHSLHTAGVGRVKVIVVMILRTATFWWVMKSFHKSMISGFYIRIGKYAFHIPTCFVKLLVQLNIYILTP